jgi:hypothetical protein
VLDLVRGPQVDEIDQHHPSSGGQRQDQEPRGQGAAGFAAG